MKEEIILKILNCKGFKHQAIVWIEELSELTKELTKILRKGYIDKKSLRNTQLEITDVQFCLDQIKMAIGYSTEQQEKDYKYKVKRTLKRIKKDGKRKGN